MKIKKIPMRTCVITREKCEKKDLIRVVRTPEQEVKVDETGKMNGKGAYLKKDKEVIKKAKQNKILEKIINPEKVITKLMLLAGSFILILNQFTLEYLLFPESAVMCLGVLFNVIAIKFMVDNPKCKYIKIFLALLVAVFCYQGVLNMFPVIAILVYIVKQILDKREYKVKEKEFFVEMIKLAFIVIVVLAICYEEFSEEQLVFKGNTLYMLVY